jgi:hypothetical protein
MSSKKWRKMPEFVDPRPEWKDSEGPTPLSWRFGLYRRWHPDLDFLYEVRINGSLAWAPCLRFTSEEKKDLVVCLAPENTVHQKDCTKTDSRIQSKESKLVGRNRL